MKKKIFKIVSLLFVCMIMFTSGVVAARISAKDIGFTSSDEGWEVDNVEEAMNDLYDLIENQKITKIEIDYSVLLFGSGVLVDVNSGTAIYNKNDDGDWILISDGDIATNSYPYAGANAQIKIDGIRVS